MANEDKVVFYEAETATGRKLGVVNSESHGLFKVAYVDGKGGGIPDSLSGRFTGVRFAREAVDSFVSKTNAIAAAHTRKPKNKDETVSV